MKSLTKKTIIAGVLMALLSLSAFAITMKDVELHIGNYSGHPLGYTLVDYTDNVAGAIGVADCSSSKYHGMTLGIEKWFDNGSEEKFSCDVPYFLHKVDQSGFFVLQIRDAITNQVQRVKMMWDPGDYSNHTYKQTPMEGFFHDETNVDISCVGQHIYDSFMTPEKGMYQYS